MAFSFVGRLLGWLRLLVAVMLCWLSLAWSDNLPEYQLKAGFMYNFVTFTEWPSDVSEILNLCVYGTDSFGRHLDALQGKTVGVRVLATERVSTLDELGHCEIVFVARSASDDLPRVVNKLKRKPVLTMADTPGASHQGVMLNMVTRRNKVTFEANLAAARGSGLNLSSKLLRLAAEVIR